MANIREAFEYASKNPNSDFAKNLAELAKSGALNIEAKNNGIDLSPFQPKETLPQTQEVVPQKNFMEKVASFTGGEKIGQGLGQALANPEISKNINEAQNKAIEIQGNLLQRIKEKKALGEDTSNLENALNNLNQAITTTGTQTGQLLNQKGLTTKQVLGDAIQLGTTVLGTGQLPGVAKSTVGATGVVAGAKQGAIKGAKAGAIYGASSGVSESLKQDKTLAETALGGVEGAVGGAITGGALGGIVGGVSGGLKQRALNKAQAQKDSILDLVSPKMTEQVKQQALKEGRVTEQGLLSAGKITPSKRDIQLAEAVDGIVSPKKSIIKNIEAISSKVQEINSGVKSYVSSKKVPFNTNQLRTQLNNGKSELDLIFASDKSAEKTYNAVVKKFIELVKNKDTAGLLDARQEFDKIPAVKKLLESDKLGENARKEIVSTVRTQANKYIANLLPQNNIYRSTLLKESRMIEAITNMIEKNTDKIGKNKLQIFADKYPIAATAIGTAALTALGLKGFGIGKSIISSTD